MMDENSDRGFENISSLHGQIKRSVRANFSLDMFKMVIDLPTHDVVHLLPIEEYVGHIGVENVLERIPERRLKEFCKARFGWVEDDE